MATPTKAMIPMELQGVRPAGSYTFDELYRFAQMCHTSGLFEDVTDAAQAMIKIVKGQELGLPPTTAMTAFDIIKKRLFIKPWAIAAKINACGYGGYKVVEQTDVLCTIAFRRKYAGEGWVALPPVSYTHAEAKAHGLVDRSPHWKASPAHMLYQRCMGRGGAVYFPELLAGLEPPPDDTPISPERHEQNIIDLFGDAAGRSATVPPPATSTRREEPPVLQTSPVSTRQEGIAWDTLREHRDDGRLPMELLERIDAALSPLAPASASEAHQVADAVLAWLDNAEVTAREEEL